MATKTKTKKKPKPKRTAGKKVAKKITPKKAGPKRKVGGKKTTGGKAAGALKEQVRRKSRSVDTVAFPREVSGARPGEQSGDLQGLSNFERADSESVDELLEEGNPFEAGIVTGVEEADDSEEEVRTHEVPEDDVPDEYLDNE